MKIFLDMIVFIIIWVTGGMTFLTLFSDIHLSWVMAFGYILGAVSAITSDIISSFIVKKVSK